MIRYTKHIVLLVLILTGCSSTKKANKKIDKAVSLTSPKYINEYIISKYGDSYFNKIKDTLIDTVFFHSYINDTFFIFKNKIDTFFLKTENCGDIRIIKDTVKLYVSGEEKIDTLIKVKYIDRYIVNKIPDNEHINKYINQNKFKFLFILIFFVFLVRLISKYIR